MNLSNGRAKKPFISLQFCFFTCIHNIVPIALIVSEAAIFSEMLKNSPLKIRFPEN